MLIQVIFGAGALIGSLIGYKTGKFVGKRTPEAKARKVVKTVKNVKVRMVDKAKKAAKKLDDVLGLDD